jgi:N-acyl-D-aspartate/D-glutamate deacylase
MATSLLLLASLLAAGPVEADLVLRGGTIHDGSGGEPAVGDVAIKAGRIVAVGKFEISGSPRVIDCDKLIVAPGFIDLHSHSDSGIVKPETRQNANFLMQGVTTVVTGNCGGGPTDVAAYFKQIDEHGAGTNVLHLVPHGSLREKVMGNVNRPPSPAELEKMKQLTTRAMRDGACGMATGLIYTPGSYSKTDELIALAQVVGEHGGIYASHVRDEGSGLLESFDEILTIGREAKLPVHISHIKVSGRANWGLAPDGIAKLRAAREAGQRVTADQYPYNASSTSLAAHVIPDELRDWKVLEIALADPTRGPKVREQIQKSLNERDGGECLVVANFSAQRDWQGKNLVQIAKETSKTPLEIVITIMSRGGAAMINFGMQEDEVRLFMREDFVATASDGSTMSLDSPSQPHPRAFGCFPRKIGYYSIEGRVIPVAQAIRSASGLPADILGLKDRGYLRPDCHADVVVFDPAAFRDTATFEKPLQWATGVKLLLVNGEIAVESEKPTGKLAGRAIRHPQSQP